MLNELLCFFGLHRWLTKKRLIGDYTLTITLYTKGDCGTERYDVYLDECEHCGKRRLKTVGGEYANKHNGIKKLRYRWTRFRET